MENIWTIIISASISGLLATLLTLFVKKKSNDKNEKREIFKTLLSYRYDMTNQINVNAMNRIQSTFYGKKNVLEAWKSFNDEANKPISDNNQSVANSINDKYLKLLEQIAIASGYKNIKWDDIKLYYFPRGLAQKITEENALRTETLKNVTITKNNQNLPLNEQMAYTLIVEALKQPNGIEQIVKLMEATNNTKGNGR